MANKKGKRAKDNKRRKSKQDLEPEEFVPKAFKKKDNKDKDKSAKTKGKRADNKKTKKKLLKRVILIIILIGIIVFAIWLGITSNTWATLAKEMTINENSIVLDTDGNTIATLGIERKNEKISLEEMPENLKNAYVAIEDERFYNHHGIDIKRTGGAILSYVVNFGSSSYGGSTITQQLVKNLTGDSTDSITRKVKEWWKAFILETALSKDEILETYLNIIYVGPNIYGVQTGAIYYFNKPATELSLAECAFLAGINNSPNSYNPFGDEDNSEKINNRTKTVLGKMQELGYITDEELQVANAEVDNGLNFSQGTIESQEPIYSYHTDALILEITEDIEEKYNISEDFATNFINMAGLTIQSTQDTSIQEETETEFEKSRYQLASKTGGDSAQAAMVIIDHKTGHVVACTGGLGKKTEARPLNRATQSVRQTGSSIKPIAVLAPAIDKKVITGASIYDDTERDFADGYHPVDYSNQLRKDNCKKSCRIFSKYSVC